MPEDKITDAAPEQPNKSGTRKHEIVEWLQAFIVCIVLTIIVRTFLFTVVMVDGKSMEPTLHTGDRVFAAKMYGNLEYGDIVIFRPKENPARPYIKRVIATEGQTVDIDYYTSQVKVDGAVVDEPFINDQEITLRGDLELPIEVMPNTIFVMGDNRNNSHDSRSSEVGLVDKSTIIGRAIFRLYPFGSVPNMSFEKKVK